MTGSNWGVPITDTTRCVVGCRDNTLRILSAMCVCLRSRKNTLNASVAIGVLAASEHVLIIKKFKLLLDWVFQYVRVSHVNELLENSLYTCTCFIL